MKIGRKLKKILFNKNIIICLTVFLLSTVRLYADVLPFGISAVSVWGSEAPQLFCYLLGILFAGGGFNSFLRHIISPVIYIFLKKILKGRVPEFIITGFSVILGGALSLIILNEERILYFSFVAIEALASAAFTFIFKRAKEAIFDKLRGGRVSETDFAFLIVTAMCLCLSFSELETGRVSISASLILLIGMASSYKHKAPVSVVVNMAAGFFSFVFTPQNLSSVAYLTLSGFIASLLKKYGKFLIPFVYIALLPLFLNMKVNLTTFYLEDIFISSLVFLLIPVRIMDFINVIPNTEKEEASCLRLSERIKTVADTFYSISEIFSGLDLRTQDIKHKDASELAVEAVCEDCAFKGKCSREAEAILKNSDGGNLLLYKNELKCRRKRELISAFSGNYRILRIENMWQNHLREETEAMSGQMMCISKMLEGLSLKDEIKLLRDETAENEICAALKKNGINVKKISAGRNVKGIFQVILEMIPCKEKTLCDDLIPTVIHRVTGVEVVRFGAKRCKSCRVGYTEIPKFRVQRALSALSLEEISGDSSAFCYVDEEHFAVALSDGMGTGRMAKYKSSAAVNLSLKLLSVGMDLPSAVSMVNSLLLRQGGRDFASLDISLINLETGEVEFVKNAAAAGYILRCNGKVKRLVSEGSPLGIVGKTETEVLKSRISEGDFLIMVSDGIVDSFGKQGEDVLEQKISEFTLGSAPELADFIMTEALKSSGKKVRDDMTVVTVGCIKKQKSGNAKEKGGVIYEKRQESNYFR